MRDLVKIGLLLSMLSVGLLVGTLAEARPIEEATPGDFFTRLIENKADLTHAWAVFEVTNPLDSPIIISDYDITIKTKAFNTEAPTSYKLYELKTVTETFQERETATHECSINTLPNNTQIEVCSHSVGDIVNVERTFVKEIPLKVRAIPAGKSIIVKLVADYKAELGPIARDWIPTLTVNSMPFEHKEWAWWNSSFGNRKRINISNPTAYDIVNTPPGLPNGTITVTFDTSISDASQELRITACDSENTTTCGTESEVPYHIINTDDSGYADITFLSNVSGNSWRAYYAYYSCATCAGDPIYDTPLHIKGISGSDAVTFGNGSLYMGFTNGRIYGLSIGNADSYSGRTDTEISFEDGGAKDGQCQLDINSSVYGRLTCTQTDGSDGNISYNFWGGFNYSVLNFSQWDSDNAEILRFSEADGLGGEQRNFFKRATSGGTWNMTISESVGGIEPVYGGGQVFIGTATTYGIEFLWNYNAIEGTANRSVMYLRSADTKDPQVSFSDAGAGTQDWNNDNVMIGIEGINSSATAEARFQTFIADASTYSLGPEEEPGTISIVRPLNQVYWGNPIDLAVTNSSAVQSWRYSLDGGANVSFTPNTTIGATRGSHTLVVYAQDVSTSDWLGDTQSFTVKYVTVANETKLTSGYETNTSTFSLALNVTNRSAFNTTLGSLNVNFTYNGTTQAYSASSGNITQDLVSVGDQGILYLSIPYFHPLSSFDNNTNRTFNWNYSLQFTDGSGRNSNSTDIDNQTILWAYNLSELIVNPAVSLIYDNITGNASIFNPVDNATIAVTMFFNYSGETASLNTSSGFMDYYTAVEQAPNISNASQNFDVIAQLSVTNRGNRLQNSSIQISLVNRINVTVCSLGDPGVALIYNFTNEYTGASLNGNGSATFQFWTATGPNITASSYQANVANLVYCVSPSWATFYANAHIDYSSTNYSERSLFLDHATLNNISNSELIYVLPEENSTTIEIKVYNEFLSPVSGVIVQALKYLVSENRYITVDTGMSDFGGQTYLELETGSNIYYSYRIIDRGRIVLSEPSSELPSGTTEKTLVLNPTTLYQIFDYIDSISYSCTYSDSTFIVTCVASDTSLLAITWTLKAFENRTFGQDPTCSDTDTASSVILTCDLGNTTGKTFEWQLIVEFPDNLNLVITSGSVVDVTPPYGTMGLFATAFLVILMALGGAHARRPEVPLLGSIIAFFVGWALQLFILEISLVMVIGLVGAFIAWRLQS